MKFKKIPLDYLSLCFDRLMRFKHTREKYERVFLDVINKFASKEMREGINSTEDMVAAVEEIINSSVAEGGFNDSIKAYEREVFFQDEDSEKFLNNKINFPRHPEKIKKVVLCEGVTEEILLPVLAEKCGFDISGIYILGAGGKNQVGRKYLKMLEEVRLPIFILLDFDAVEIQSAILPNLREIDDVYLIENGEFEDILPKEIIIDALNFNYPNEHKCSEDDFRDDIKMSKNLDEIFKIKGFGDFKKADFAIFVKDFLEQNDVKFGDCEIRTIVGKIAKAN